MYGSLGGAELKIVRGRRAPERAGGLVRSPNGPLINNTLWEAVSFDLDVLAVDDAEAAAIYAVANRSLQLFTGTIPGAVDVAGVSVRAEVKDDAYERVWHEGAHGHYRVLSLSIRQTL